MRRWWRIGGGCVAWMLLAAGVGIGSVAGCDLGFDDISVVIGRGHGYDRGFGFDVFVDDYFLDDYYVEDTYYEDEYFFDGWFGP